MRWGPSVVADRASERADLFLAGHMKSSIPGGSFTVELISWRLGYFKCKILPPPPHTWRYGQNFLRYFISLIIAGYSYDLCMVLLER
jgi:hypothetical protein